MKSTKFIGAAAIAALALMAFAGTASATTLEIGGVKQTGAVTIKATLKSGTSTILKDTAGVFLNTCTASTVEGKTSTFTGTAVSGPVSTLTFKPCTNEEVIAHKMGTLSVENFVGTTNGTVRSTGAEVTVPVSGIGIITCTTSNTDLGTLTGVASGNATIDINAVIPCPPLFPTTKWEGTYTVTNPAGLGATT